LKVLFAVHDFLPLHPGGTEVHTAGLAQALAARGCDVAIACTERDLGAREGEVRERRWNGLRVLELVHQREYADIADSWLEPVGSRGFRAILDRERPDVVHLQHLARWGAACLALARESAAVALTLHDFHLLCERGTFLRAAGRLCVDARGRSLERCGDCLAHHPRRAGTALEAAMEERREFHRRALAAVPCAIAPSRFLAGVFRDFLGEASTRIEVLGSGCVGPWRAPRASDPTAPLRVAYVGGLYPSKGVHVLVDAMRALDGAPIELDVHGVLDWFPEYARDLEQRARGLPVRFRGRFEPADIDRVLARADVLAVPSLWPENRPLTIQDAFRNGLCVVASDLGGIPELVGHERNGLLVPPDDARALAAALRRLAVDRELAARLASGRPSLPSIDEVADRTLELYASANGPGARALGG
jgi:glycosyltransferase involved in cell wall biosynthesis